MKRTRDSENEVEEWTHRQARITFARGNFTSMKRNLDLSIGSFVPCIEAYYRDGIVPNTIIPKLLTSADRGPGEDNETFSNRRKDASELRAEQTKLSEACAQLTSYLAACPIQSIRDEMNNDPRQKEYLKTRNYMGMLELIKDKSEPTAGTVVSRSILGLMTKMSQAPSYGNFNSYLSNFEEHCEAIAANGLVIPDEFKAVFLMEGLDPTQFKELIVDWTKSSFTLKFDDVMKRACSWYNDALKPAATSQGSQFSIKGQSNDDVKARYVQQQLGASSPNSSKSKGPKDRSKKKSNPYRPQPAAVPGSICENPKCSKFGMQHGKESHYFKDVDCKRCGRTGHYTGECRSTRHKTGAALPVARATHVTANVPTSASILTSKNFFEGLHMTRAVRIKSSGYPRPIASSANKKRLVISHPRFQQIREEAINALVREGVSPQLSEAELSSNTRPSQDTEENSRSNEPAISLNNLINLPQFDHVLYDNEDYSNIVVSHAMPNRRNNIPHKKYWNEQIIMDTGCFSVSIVSHIGVLLTNSWRELKDCNIEGFNNAESEVTHEGCLPFAGRALVSPHSHSHLLSTPSVCKALGGPNHEVIGVEDGSTYQIFKIMPDGKLWPLLAAPAIPGIGYVCTLGDLITAANTLQTASPGTIQQTTTRQSEAYVNSILQRPHNPKVSLPIVDSPDPEEIYSPGPIKLDAESPARRNMWTDLTSPPIRESASAKQLTHEYSEHDLWSSSKAISSTLSDLNPSPDEPDHPRVSFQDDEPERKRHNWSSDPTFVHRSLLFNQRMQENALAIRLRRESEEDSSVKVLTSPPPPQLGSKADQLLAEQYQERSKANTASIERYFRESSSSSSQASPSQLSSPSLDMKPRVLMIRIRNNKPQMTLVQEGASTIDAHVNPKLRRRAEIAFNLHSTAGNHMSDALFGKMLDDGLFPQLKITSDDLRTARSLFGKCDACIQGKSKAAPKAESLPPPATSPAQNLVADLVQFTEPTVGGNKWSLILVDEFCGYIMDIPSTTKSQSDLQVSLATAVSTMNGFNRKVKQVTTDPENVLKSLEPFLGSYNIKYVSLVPGRHANLVERYIQHMYRLEDTYLCDLPYEPPAKLAGELRSYVLEAMNDTPNKKSFPYTPNQIMAKRNPIVRPYRWGTCGLFHTYSTTSEHAEYGIIVGMTAGAKFRVYLPTRDRVLVRNKPIKTYDDVPSEWQYPMRNSTRQMRLSTLREIKRDGRQSLARNISDMTEHEIREHLADLQDSKSVSIDDNNNNYNMQTKSSIGSIIKQPSTNSEAATGSISNTELFPDSDRESDNNLYPSETYNESEASIIEETPFMDHDDVDSEAETVPESASPFTENKAPIALESNLTAENEEININNDNITPKPKISGKKRHKVDFMPDITIMPPPIRIRPEPTVISIKVPVRRSERNSFPDGYYKQLNKGWRPEPMQLDKAAAKALHISLKSALRDTPDAARESLALEIESLLVKHLALTNIKYTDIPGEYRGQIILIHCFLKDKRNPAGEFLKLKSRIVAGGNSQDESTFDDTASPTVNPATLMMLINIMASQDFECATYDVPSAFVRVPTDDNIPIYGIMEPSLSNVVISLHPEYAQNQHKGSLYFKFNKYLYGLKQSPRKFYEFMVRELASLGYEVSPLDECLFTKRVDSGIVYIALHVDDMFQVSPNAAVKAAERKLLKDKFDVEEALDSPYSFIGMTITRDRHARTAKVTMTAMIEKLIEKYASELPAKKTPSTQALFRTEFKEEELLSPAEQKVFISINMAVLYVARYCRIDVLLSPTVLASRLKRASKSDLREILRVLQYFKHTPTLGLLFGGTAYTNNIKLGGVSDASHSILDGRGIAAMAITLGSAPVATRCWIIKFGTLSSTESELAATTELVTYIIWARAMLDYMGYPQLEPTPMLQDNQASIALNIRGRGSFKRSKHMLARGAFCTQEINDGTVIPIYTQTENIFVDMLTKAHPETALVRNREDAHIMHVREGVSEEC